MKRCTLCNQTYTDDSLNFCLNDGGTLEKLSDDAPPTVFMNQSRTTSESNWATNDPFKTPNYEPLSPWQQNNPINQNPGYLASPLQYQSPNQTLPLISLILGILGVLLCCYGFPFGIAALIMGFIGHNNAKNDPMRYGGYGLAIAGMILGAISIIELVVFVLLALAGGR